MFVKIFKVVPVVVILPWIQILQDVIKAISFFCKGARVKEKNSSRTTAEQSQKQASIPLKKQTQLSSRDHCYAKDPNEEVKTGNR